MVNFISDVLKLPRTFKRKGVLDTLLLIKFKKKQFLIKFLIFSFRMRDMVLVGIILNIVCLLTTMIPIHTYGIPMFDLMEVPEWANVTLQSQQC